jgi:hypothetical protein
MIDTIERGKLNIKEFVIGESGVAAEILFDPKIDISPKAWDMMSKSLKLFFSDMTNDRRSADIVVRMAADMKLLSANDTSRTPILSERNWRVLGNIADGMRNSGEWDKYISILSSVRILDRELSKDEKFSINPSVKEEILDDIYNNRGFITHKQMLADMRIIFPDETFIFPDNYLQQIKSVAESFRTDEYTEGERRSERMRNLNLINNAKLIDPVQTKGLFSSVSYSWKDMKEELSSLIPINEYEIFHVMNAREYASYARALLLYSAQEIIVTENGMQLNMPEPAQSFGSESKMPEMRKF